MASGGECPILWVTSVCMLTRIVSDLYVLILVRHIATGDVVRFSYDCSVIKRQLYNKIEREILLVAL